MAKSSAGKQTGWQRALAEAGVEAVTVALEERGWAVLPAAEAPLSDNVDMHIIRDDREAQIAVVATNRAGWVAAGVITDGVKAGGPVFNRAASPQAQADFVVLVTAASQTGKRDLPTAWRFFIVPVDEAEILFRRTVDAVFNRPRSDGSRRESTGPIAEFVGPGEAPVTGHGNQADAFTRYEGSFDLLDRFEHPGY